MGGGENFKTFVSDKRRTQELLIVEAQCKSLLWLAGLVGW